MSVCPPSMPNMFIYFGPNGGPMTGSTILMLEWVCDYLTATIQKVQREYIKSIVVKYVKAAIARSHFCPYYGS